MSANFFALDSVHIQPTCYYWVEYYLANIKLDMFNMHDYFKFWTSGQRLPLTRPGPARHTRGPSPPCHRCTLVPFTGLECTQHSFVTTLSATPPSASLCTPNSPTRCSASGGATPTQPPGTAPRAGEEGWSGAGPCLLGWRCLPGCVLPAPPPGRGAASQGAGINMIQGSLCCNTTLLDPNLRTSGL